MVIVVERELEEQESRFETSRSQIFFHQKLIMLVVQGIKGKTL